MLLTAVAKRKTNYIKAVALNVVSPTLHAIHSALPQLRDRLLGFLVEQVRRGVQTTIMYSVGRQLVKEVS